MANASVEHHRDHVHSIDDVRRSELEQVATQLVLGVLYLLGALATTPNNARDLAQQVLGELKTYTPVGAA